MASSLLSNTNSQQQYQANRLTNRPNLIKVIVEDEDDVVLWHKILKRWRPDKDFHITPYCHASGVADSKGKGHILQMAAGFGPYLLGCVDSDYDYLLENYTIDGKTIKNNPYILQTFGYSIENLVCQPYGISEKLLECKKHSCDIQRNANAAFATFITEISRAIYPVLLWHLMLKKENRQRNDWPEILGNDNYRPILLDSSLSIEQIQTQVIAKARFLSSQSETNYTAAHPDLIVSKEILKTELKTNYGLNEDNAYLFVRGHDLFDFLHFTFFTPLERQIYDEHLADIRNDLPATQINNAINHYRKTIRPFATVHLSSCAFLDDPANTVTVLLDNSVHALPL